jgi:predicted RND superfamily exporter protein
MRTPLLAARYDWNLAGETMNRRVHQTLLRFADFLLSHPILVFGGLLISAFISLAIARGVKFDFTPQSIYRGNDELLAYAEEFKQTFGYDEGILLVVLKANGEQDALSVPALQWQIDICEQLKAVPGVIRTDAVGTLQVPHFSFGGLSLQPMIDEVVVNQTASDRVRKLLADSQMVRGGLLSEDDSVSVIAVFLDPAAKDIDSLKKLVGEVKAVIAQHPVPTGFEMLLSGLPELRIEIVQDLMADMATLMPLGGVVYLIVLGLMFRRLSGALLPLCAVGIGLTWTMATFAITGDTLNLVSNILPILLMIIGVSSCVQIVTCYAEQSAAGLDRRTAAREAIARMAPPCLLAAVTTAVGFASLYLARSEVLSMFGGQAAIGIGFQYVSTLLTLGALFRFFPAPTYVGTNETTPGVLTRIVTFLGYAVARHAWATMACAALLVLAAAWSGSHVVINTYAIRETFHEEHPSMKAMRVIEKHLSGIMPLEISLTADHAGAFMEPAVFQQVAEAEQSVKSLPGILSGQSYADVFRELLHKWPGRKKDETDLELVPLGEVGEARLKRTADFVQRFPEVFHYYSFVSEDGKRARIRLRLQEIGSRETLKLIEELQKRLAAVFPANGAVRAELTGEGYVNAQALTILVRDLFNALLSASLVIFALIAFEFRSFRVGLIAALPNLTPLAITLGYMGLMKYDMNVANVIAFTICLGLADDNTIYFLYRFRQEMERTGDKVLAVRQAFLGTGRAIVLTSMLLLFGMAVLFRSDFVPTRRFAELTSVTIIGNLLGVLLLLPACLVLFWKQTPQQTAAALQSDD